MAKEMDPTTVRYVMKQLGCDREQAETWLECADGDIGMVCDAYLSHAASGDVADAVLAARIARLEQKLADLACGCDE